MTKEKMKIIRLSSIILLIGLTISCDSEEDSQINITGTARYIETDLDAKHIPIKLTIYNLENPFRANTSDVVAIDEVITDNDGKYSFSIDRSILPKDASYILSISTDSLVITGELSPGCLPSGIAGGGFSSNNIITRDLKIDFPTFLHITFDKLDHSTADRVRLTQLPCILLESTLEKPDTTILEKLHFHSAKIVDIQYYTFDAYGVTTEYTIADVQLLKKDTIKIKIEY